MGCDIHVHVEVKINDKWEHYSAPEVPRNYALFAKMAGVRNSGDIEPISKPKGLPDDLTNTTKRDSLRCDESSHSHSWLDLNELRILQKWIYAQKSYPLWDFGQVFGNNLASFMEARGEFPEIRDVRAVFWFNN